MLRAFKLKYLNQALSIALLFILVSCEDRKIDTKAVKEEMKAREIKVIPEAKILEKGMELGNELSSDFVYDESLNKAIMVTKEDVSIESVSYFTLFGADNSLIGKEKMLFEAYLYNSEKGITSEPNVQSLSSIKSLLYTKPMVSGGKTIGMWSIIFLHKEVVQLTEN